MTDINNTPNTENTGTTENTSEVRDNLREAGDALLAAGSALGAALGKFAEGVPERFKSATDSARETLNSANTEGEVRSWVANVANEAEKAFNSLREKDVTITDEAKENLRSSVADVRANFNERLDKLTADNEGSVIDELRNRFDSLVERVQKQFAGEEKGDVIDGEVVE